MRDCFPKQSGYGDLKEKDMQISLIKEALVIRNGCGHDVKMTSESALDQFEAQPSGNSRFTSPTELGGNIYVPPYLH